MKRSLSFVIMALACLAQADDSPTMAELERRFEQKIVAIAKAETPPAGSMEEAIFQASISVFSNHTDIVSREADRRLAELPAFTREDIPTTATVRTFDLSELFVSDLKEFVNAFGWQPKRVAQTAKASVLTRQLGVEQFGRRVLLKAALPNRYYRLDDRENPTIVVESLGDIFVVECWKHERGIFVPRSLMWLQLPLRATPPTEP